MRVALVAVLCAPILAAADTALPSPKETDVYRAETPWPRVLPCAHPSRLVAPRRVVWSGASGQPRVELGDDSGTEARLDGAFPVGKLDLLAPAGDLVLGCAPQAEEDRRPYIRWELCGSICSLAVGYKAKRPPHRRAELWLRRPGPRRFEELVAKDRDLAGRRAAWIAFARDLAVDLRDAVGAACAGNRCSKPLAAVDAAVAKFLAQPAVDAREIDRPADDEVHPFGGHWQWSVGDALVECSTIRFSESAPYARCFLELPVAEHKVRFDAGASTLVLDGVEVLRWDGDLVVLSDPGLALR
jgi:hypothetical protein